MSLALLLVGPSKILGLPDLIIVIYAGMFFVGFFAAFMFVPIIPEMIDAV